MLPLPDMRWMYPNTTHPYTATQETVFVPFTFLSLASGRVVRGEGGGAATRRRGVHESLAEFVRAQDVPMQERTIVVTVGGSRNSQAIAMLKVHIHPRPFVLDRTIRFYNAEHEVLKRTIIMQAGCASPRCRPRWVLSTHASHVAVRVAGGHVCVGAQLVRSSATLVRARGTGTLRKTC